MLDSTMKFCMGRQYRVPIGMCWIMEAKVLMVVRQSNCSRGEEIVPSLHYMLLSMNKTWR